MKFREISHGSFEYRKTVELRSHILREPLKLTFSEEELAAEASDRHLVCEIDDDLAACLVLTPVDQEVVHMRQLAVVKDLRGMGVGRALVKFSEEFARKHGYSRMKLHAREHVVAFYEKLGYETVGEAFIEVTVPHREMGKRLVDGP